jgi:hypothetical protein
MATLQEVDSRIEELKAQIDSLTPLINRGGPTVVDGQQYSQKELLDTRNTLLKELRSLEKVVAPVGKSRNALSKAERDLATARERSADPRGLFQKTGTLTASERSQKLLIEKAIKDIERLEPEVTRLQQEFSSVSARDFSLPTDQRFRPSSELASRILQMGGTAARRGEMAGEEALGTETADGGVSAGTGVGGGGGVALTPEQRKERRAGRQQQRFEKAAAELRRMAPQYAWILEIDQTKYPDVRKLLQRATRDGMFESPEGIQRFIGELNGTTFFSELREKGTKQKIVNLVGDLGFDDSNMGKLLANASNLQWDDDTLSLEVYKEAFRKNEDGTYVHSQAQARAKKSSSYLRVQNIGTSFFNQLDDDTVERVLTGGMIEDDVLRQQRELAKARYGHLSNLIDQGLSLDAITRSYRDEAARLLERDPNDVRMADAMYQTAYDFTDESGQKRLMTTGEWTRQLRTDTQYGWDKTENAKREAQQLSSSIIQAFGRVM